MNPISAFVKNLIESYIATTIDLLKIEAAITGLKILKGVRRFIIVVSLLILCAVILGCGFLLIPISLLLFADWLPQTKAIVGISIGAIYILIPLITMSALLSQKRWVKWSGISKLLRQIDRQR
jgi:hypothetical protein